MLKERESDRGSGNYRFYIDGEAATEAATKAKIADVLCAPRLNDLDDPPPSIERRWGPMSNVQAQVWVWRDEKWADKPQPKRAAWEEGFDAPPVRRSVDGS